MNSFRIFLETALRNLAPRPRRIWIFWCIAMVFVALTGVTLIDLRKANATPAIDKPPKAALTISVAEAKTVKFDESIEASGPIVPWQEAIIGAPIAGLRLNELNADVGTLVRKGQILAQYDTAGLYAMQAQLLASIAQARAVSAQAAQNNERAATLKESGAVSEQDLLQFSTLKDTAKAQLASAQAALQANQVQLRYATIRAPDDGTISSRNATLGSVGSVGQELFRIIRRNRIEWRAQLTPVQAALVAPGQTVAVSLPDSPPTTGRVRLLAPSMDPQSRLLTAYVDIAGASHARAGMYVTGEIHTGLRAMVSVPAASIVVRDGNSYVFVVKQGTRASTVLRRKVVVGRSHDFIVEVLGGLASGEMVANLGAGFLEEGDVVRIAPELEKLPVQ